MRLNFDSNYYEARCRAMNETEGKLDDGFNCERCRNKGYIYTLSEDNELLSSECPDCFKARTSLLADDNRNIVASVDGSTVLYDKDNPRTEITIMRKSNGNGELMSEPALMNGAVRKCL